MRQQEQALLKYIWRNSLVMPIWNQHNSTGFCAEAATVWRPGGDPSPRPPCKQVSLGTVSSMLLALRGAAGFHGYMPKEGDSSQLHHTMQVRSWINPGNQSSNILKEKASHRITRFLQRHKQTQLCHVSSLQTLRQTTVQEEKVWKVGEI